MSKLRRRWYRIGRNRAADRLAGEIGEALRASRDEIPVLVISYNNASYVRGMVAQLRCRGVTPIVVDNATSAAPDREALRALAAAGEARVVFSAVNFGHTVGFLEEVYPVLPEVFAYTDPDLRFADDLPGDFLRTLRDLTDTYRVFKAGMALPLPDDDAVTARTYRHRRRSPFPYERVFTLAGWESQFWRKRLVHDRLEVWAADVDTTFAVCNKAHYTGDFFDAVRVGGPFGALHLPWYPGIDPMTDAERAAYQEGNRSSHWS